jgi:hypothetical protein
MKVKVAPIEDDLTGIVKVGVLSLRTKILRQIGGLIFSSMMWS